MTFHESIAYQRFEDDDQEVESDYCDDLYEIYELNGAKEDAVLYKTLHLMDKKYEAQNEFPEKY